MEQIFLEPNEEITSVIDKLATASGGKIALIVPKNSTLFQSLVNLKLLAKQSKELNKDVVLITSNKVGQRLASQVGIETYGNLGTVKDSPKPPATPSPSPATTQPTAETLPDGTPIRRYVPPAGSEAVESTPEPVAVEPEVVEADQPAVVSVEPTVPAASTTTISADEPQEPLSPPAAEKVEPEELPTIISRAPVARKEFHFQMPWKSLIAAAILLLLAFGVTYVLLPKATVTVTLPAKAVSETLDLSIKTVADQADGTLVGNLLSVDKSLNKPVTATGKKDIGTKATGSIAFKNCEDTQSHAIAAGSKVTSSSKVFTTNSTITIPSGSFSGGGTVCNSSTVSVTVTAEIAGEAHNITNGTFTINGQSSRISGSGSTGGGTTKQVTVLTQEDVDKALAELEKQAIEEATTELRAKAEGQTIVEGGITQTIKTRSSDKKVGDQVDASVVTFAATLSTIAFDQSAVEAKHTEALTAKIDEGQRLEIPADTPPTTVFKEYSADKTVLVLTVSGSGFGVPDVNKPQLSKAIRHSSRAKAESRLKDDYHATEVKIDLSPNWWFDRLPILSGAITVEYGFSESSETAEEPETEPVP